MAMAERRSIEGTSLSVNSVIILRYVYQEDPEEIDKSLKDLSYLFKSYLSLYQFVNKRVRFEG